MEGGNLFRGGTLILEGGGGEELHLGRGKLHLGEEIPISPHPLPLCINTAVNALLDETWICCRMAGVIDKNFALGHRVTPAFLRPFNP